MPMPPEAAIDIERRTPLSLPAPTLFVEALEHVLEYVGEENALEVLRDLLRLFSAGGAASAMARRCSIGCFIDRLPSLVDGETASSRVIANGVPSGGEIQIPDFFCSFFECGACHRAIHTG
jgi:hypothetical protein